MFRTIFFSLVVLGTLTACQPEGPVEKAGKKVDNAVENLKEG